MLTQLSQLPRHRYSDVPKWPFLSIVILSFASLMANAVESTLNPSQSETLLDKNIRKTLVWIRETATPELVDRKLEVIIAEQGWPYELDDALLEAEFERRFVHGAAWRTDFSSAQNQALCWLAECNKRMLRPELERRAENRNNILEYVDSKLLAAASPSEICELLDIAFRTVFYSGFVVPRDGGDSVIDLYKKYVGHQEQTVHNFACERLRFMGAVWRTRYDEILQNLIENAPELRDQLAARRIPGIHVDVLLGGESEPFEPDEEQFLKVDAASPQELKQLAQKTLAGGMRVRSASGSKAIEKLIVDGCNIGGDSSINALANLVREGIQFQTVLYNVAKRAVEASNADSVQASQKCLDEVLKAFMEIPREKWPREIPRGNTRVLGKLQNVIQQIPKKSEAQPSRTLVEEKVATAISAAKELSD